MRPRPVSHRGEGQAELSGRAAWVILAVSILCRSVLSTIVALLLWGVLPGLVGFQTTTVMSGSMSPRLQVGDAVVLHPVAPGSLKSGQVLLFDDPDHPGRLRLHRLVSMEGGRLVTRGDANESNDSSPVRADAVRGAAFLRVPGAALPEYWVKTGQVLPLIGSGVVVLALFAGTRLGLLLADEAERERRRHRGVRLPGAHRAIVGGIVVVSLGGMVVAPPAAGDAAYSATTQNPGSTWGTTCADVTPGALASLPRLYWGYGSGSGSTVTDLSGLSAQGSLLGDAVRTTCSDGGSPSLTVGSTGAGVAVEQSSRLFPGDVTVATWFKTSNAGGVLADFGSSSTAASSSSIDRAVYMRSNGSLAFGGATVQVLGLMSSPLLCTTPAGYADNAWHLVVATWSFATGCTITVDGGTTVTQTPGMTLTLLSGYSGVWRFGYDAVASGTWPGATSRQYFIGSLDESQVYGTVLTPASRSAIYARGR